MSDAGLPALASPLRIGRCFRSDPFTTLRDNWRAGANDNPGYKNAEVEAWLDQAAVEPDRVKRRDLYLKIQKKVLEEVGFTFVYAVIENYAMQKYVMGDDHVPQGGGERALRHPGSSGKERTKAMGPRLRGRSARRRADHDLWRIRDHQVLDRSSLDRLEEHRHCRLTHSQIRHPNGGQRRMKVRGHLMIVERDERHSIRNVHRVSTERGHRADSTEQTGYEQCRGTAVRSTLEDRVGRRTPAFDRRPSMGHPSRFDR